MFLLRMKVILSAERITGAVQAAAQAGYVTSVGMPAQPGCLSRMRQNIYSGDAGLSTSSSVGETLYIKRCAGTNISEDGSDALLVIHMLRSSAIGLPPENKSGMVLLSPV